MSQLAKDNGIFLNSVDDVLSLIGSGMDGCIVTTNDISDSFFDLKNGVAGEAFQKLVNYNFKVGFVVAKNHSYGERFTELVREHKNHPVIRFFENEENAILWLLP